MKCAKFMSVLGRKRRRGALICHEWKVNLKFPPHFNWISRRRLSLKYCWHALENTMFHSSFVSLLFPCSLSVAPFIIMNLYLDKHTKFSNSNINCINNINNKWQKHLKSYQTIRFEGASPVVFVGEGKCVEQASVEIITRILIFELCGAGESDDNDGVARETCCVTEKVLRSCCYLLGIVVIWTDNLWLEYCGVEWKAIRVVQLCRGRKKDSRRAVSREEK